MCGVSFHSSSAIKRRSRPPPSTRYHKPPPALQPFYHSSKPRRYQPNTMKFSLFSIALLGAGASAAAIPEQASPVDIQARADSGSYTIAGLGTRKKQVTAAGASTFNLAVAMLETEKMTADYTYGRFTAAVAAEASTYRGKNRKLY